MERNVTGIQTRSGPAQQRKTRRDEDRTEQKRGDAAETDSSGSNERKLPSSVRACSNLSKGGD